MGHVVFSLLFLCFFILSLSLSLSIYIYGRVSPNGCATNGRATNKVFIPPGGMTTSPPEGYDDLAAEGYDDLGAQGV